MTGDVLAQERQPQRIGRPGAVAAARRRRFVGAEQLPARGFGDPARHQLLRDAVVADLVQLVHRHQRLVVKRGVDAEAVEHPAQQPSVVQAQNEVAESKGAQHVADRRAHFDLDDRRGRPDRVDVALVELAEAAARRAIGAPDRLDLVALEETRQRAPVLGDDPGQRHGQVVAQRQVGLAGGLVLAAAQDLEDQLGAFVAVLARQRLDVLERRRLERLEAVPPVDALDDPDHVLSPTDVVRQEITHAARWARLFGHRNVAVWRRCQKDRTPRTRAHNAAHPSPEYLTIIVRL